MSHKNNDKQGRFRSKVIAFRVSPEENRVLERKVYRETVFHTTLP